MTKTIYQNLGAENLKTLVDIFYGHIQKSEIAHLFQDNFDTIKRKQYMFLTQFLGGPQLYTMEYGHPKMRMRHLPHKITADAKDIWLLCMKKAINELNIEDGLKNTLYNCFPAVAQHMVNS